MSKGKNQHVTPHPMEAGKSKVKETYVLTARTQTQAEAIQIARGNLPESRIGVGSFIG